MDKKPKDIISYLQQSGMTGEKDCSSKKVKDLKGIMSKINYPGRSQYTRKDDICKALIAYLRTLETTRGTGTRGQAQRQAKTREVKATREVGVDVDISRLSLEPVYVNDLPLNSIICHTLNNDYQCHNISAKMASNLVRVAATRIFTDPFRSFLELPLNSIDSYRHMRGVDSNIGKFGFGFFSIFYFLIGHPKRFVSIKSHATNGDQFQAIIQEQRVDGVDTLTVTTTPLTGFHQGVEVLIDFKVDPIDMPGVASNVYFIIAKVHDYLDTLKLIKDVYIRVDGIYINRGSLARSWTPPPGSNIIEISLQNETNQRLLPPYFKFVDYAEGITLDVLYNVLLVPSVSSKTIKASLRDDTPATYLVKRQTKKYLDDVLYICVNSVIIAEITTPANRPLIMKPGDIHGVPPFGYEYYLLFPSSTSLPLSRDNIIWTKKVADSFRHLSESIIDEQLRQSPSDVAIYLKLLEKYASLKGSEQPLIGQTVQGLVEWVRGRPDILPVNSIKPSIITELQKYEALDASDRGRTPRTLVVFDGESAANTEHRLLPVLPTIGDIFWGKKVVPLSTESLPGGATSEGFPSLLFVPSTYVEEGSWESLSAAYVGDRLYSFDTPSILGEKQGELNELIMEHLSMRRRTTQNNVEYMYLSLLGAMTNYKSFEVESFSFRSIQPILYLILFIERFFNYVNVDQYVLALHEYFTNLKPKVTYGESPTYNLYQPIRHINLGFRADFTRTLDLLTIVTYAKPGTYGRERIDEAEDILDDRTIIEMSKPLNNILLNWLLKLDYNNNISFEPFIVNEYLTYLSLYIDITIPLRVLLSTNDLDGSYILVTMATLMMYYTSADKANPSYEPRKLTEKGCRYLVTKIKEKFKPSYLREIFFIYAFTEIIPSLIYEPLILTLHSYLSAKEDLPKFGQSPPDEVGAYSFSCNELINYVFGNEVTDSSWPGKVQPYNAKYPLIQPIQVVEISVSSGTEKEFVSAVLTELLQNSLDAVRLSANTDPIDIDLGRLGEQLVVRVADGVGISDEGILAILIPFYSQKSSTPNLTTGEFGTGFFNVYRQPYVSKVRIATNNGQRSVVIDATPQLVDGRVVDIDYVFQPNPTRQLPRGTSIAIYMNRLNDAQATDIILDYSLFVNNKVAPLKQFIRVGRQKINVPTILTYSSPDVTVYYGENFTSQLLTNGTPFVDLEGYVRASIPKLEPILPILSTGLVVDLSKSIYQGTQGRTSLVVNARLADELTTALMLTICRLIATGKIQESLWETLVPFYNSRAEYPQLQISDIGRFGLKQFANIIFGPAGSKTYVAYEINQAITLLSKEPKQSKQVNPPNSNLGWRAVDALKRERNYFPEELALLIHAWFKNKKDPQPVELDTVVVTTTRGTGRGSKSTTTATTSTTATSEEEEESLTSQFYSSFVENAWRLGAELVKAGEVSGFSGLLLPPPALGFGTSQGKAGYYDPNNHLIFINNSTIHPNLEAKLAQMIKSKTLTQVDVWRELPEFKSIISTIPVQPFIHEMGHAWRQDAHTDTGSHDIKRVKIGSGPEEVLEFDQGVQKLYSLLITRGLYSLVAKDLQ